MNWCRLYHSVLDCRKLQTLPDREFKAWVNMLLIASRNTPRGALPSCSDLAFSLRVREDFVLRLLTKWERENIVDLTNGIYYMHDWDDWNFASDDINQRVRDSRDKKRNAACNVAGNGPDTDKIREDSDKNILATSGENLPETPAAPPVLNLISLPIEKPDRFEEFWTLYPRKANKATARKTWRRKADSASAAEEIIFGLKAHMTALLQKELDYRPHAATWLNQERWRDAIEPQNSKPQQRNGWRSSPDIPNYPAAILPGPDVGVSIAPMKIIRKGHAK